MADEITTPEDQEPAKETPPSQETPKEDVAVLKAQLEEKEAALKKLAEDHQLTQQFARKLTDKLSSIYQQEQQTSDPRDDNLEFINRFREDPKGALDQHLQARLAPIVEEQLKGQEDMAIDVVRRSVGQENWDRYAKEIIEFMDPMNPMLRSKPQAWLNAYKQIRAEHFDEEVERAIKHKVESEKRASLESVSPVGGRRGGRAPVSEVEKEIARGLLGKFDEEEWRRWRGDHLTKE